MNLHYCHDGFDYCLKGDNENNILHECVSIACLWHFLLFSIRKTVTGLLPYHSIHGFAVLCYYSVSVHITNLMDLFIGRVKYTKTKIAVKSCVM